MHLFRYIDRINLMNKLIQEQRTGKPAELACRLGISVSRLFVILDQLKDQGAPIRYCRERHTYYYEGFFSVSITVEFEKLERSAFREITGGCAFFRNNFATTFFV